MKNWLKQNWWKVVIAMGMVLMGFSFFYKTVIISNKYVASDVRQSKSDLEMKLKCKEIADKLDKENNASLAPNITMLKSEYTFSKKLNTCLYVGGTLSFSYNFQGPSHRYQYIIDSLTNEELAEYITSSEDPPETVTKAQGDFYNTKIKLFSE